MNQPNSQILLSLIQGDEGKAWAADKNGWKEQHEDACEWVHIQCDSNKQIISIIIAETNLSGTIPHALGALSKLQRIRMQVNKLKGTIPRQVAALPNLIEFNIFENRITGTLPYFASTQLEILNLGHNDLHGSIPNKFIASKNKLQQLRMPQNRLAGFIPDTLMALKRLDTLDLSSNILHGTLSSSIGNLLLLQHLMLNNNFLVGSIPHQLALSSPINGKMGDLLETVHLQDNQLSGTVPLQLEYLPKLSELLLHDNKLTGEIPSTICSPNVNAFFFEGLPPSPGRDYCDAISCPVDMVALDGSDPCISCNNLHYNPYIGQTRSCNTVLNQREILKHFYENTNLRDGAGDGAAGKWKGSNNWEDDETFLCDFTGVTCDKDFHVTEIDLKARGLKGTIPDSLGFLQYLMRVDLSENELEGFLPSDLRWAPLEFLDISGNSIRGIVPPKLCDKAGLNENGSQGSYGCNKIACPIGTYSSSGRERVGELCLPCHHNNAEVLGNNSCRKVGVGSAVFGVFIFLVTLALAVGAFVVIRMKKRSRIEYQGDSMQQLEMQRPITAADLGDGRTIGEIDRFTSGTPLPLSKQSTRSNMKVQRQGSNRKFRDPKATYSDIPDHSELPYPDAENMSVLSGRSGRSRAASITETSSVRSGRSRKSDKSDESGKQSRNHLWLDVPDIT